ncbi:hypothetical protein SAZ11_26420 [Streptomyces sp. FXJ1.4098]|nr:hypothetical protein [Streptomyces sp. FXJ1.4098]
MTSLHRLGELYTAAQDVATGRTKIELVSLADTTTWHMDQAIRKLTAVLEDGDTTPLADLVSCARSLRWILLTEPFPVRHSITRAERTRDLTALVTRCAHTVAATLHGTLHELVSLAESARAEAVPPAGELLLQSLDEIGWADCVAVLASTRAAHGTQKWFEELGLSVPVASVRQHARLDVHDSAFYIGPPSLFGPAVTTAPRARNITYIFGSWVRDRSLPRTNIAAYAEGASTLRPRLYEVGDQPRPRSTPPQPEPTLYPEPVWRPAPSERAPRPDDVMARQVLLGGGCRSCSTPTGN